MKFEIPGEPISKKRHRTVRRGKFISTYDPQEQQKNNLRAYYTSKMKINGWQTFPKNISLEIKIVAYFYIPKSLPQKDKNLASWGFRNQYIVNDLDNIYKFYTDAGNKILYSDDKQIVNCTIEKYYTNDKNEEKVIIHVIPYQELRDQRTEDILSLYSPEDVVDLIKSLEVLKNKYHDFKQVSDEWEQSEICCILSKIAHNHAEKLRKIVKINEKHLKS